MDGFTQQAGSDGTGESLPLPAVIASAHATRCGAFVPVAKVDTCFRQIVRRQFQRDPVAGRDADSMFSHFSRSVGDHLNVVA